MGTIYGTHYSDKLLGSSEGDRLQGYEGNDWLVGGLGSDSIYGDDGADSLFAGENLTDSISADHSVMNIAESEWEIDTSIEFLNLLDGGNGDDLLVGSYANDLETGGNGADLLMGYKGDDFLRGENGKDNLKGNSGDDTLIGGNSKDILRGHGGNDFLSGGSGNDNLYGWNTYGDPESSNIDHFVGGSGQDSFILGTSSEIFYQVGQDKDLAIIEDLNLNEDVIRLNGHSNDYSLQVAPMTIDNQVVNGTYINYEVYDEGETLAFVVNHTDINLEAEYFEFV